MRVATQESRTGSNPEFVEHVADMNVRLTLKRIPEHNPVLAELIAKDKSALVGAMYYVETGKVEFYKSEMMTSKNFILAHHDVA